MRRDRIRESVGTGTNGFDVLAEIVELWRWGSFGRKGRIDIQAPISSCREYWEFARSFKYEVSVQVKGNVSDAVLQ